MTTIIKREGIDGIGRPLTNIEIDTNFVNLNADKIQRDGTIPLTGNLQVPGIKSTSTSTGLSIVNAGNQLIATFGKTNTLDLDVVGNFSAGNINGRNLTLTGRIISDQLNGQYNVANVGEVYRGVASLGVDDKLIITIDTIVKLVGRQGNFAVGQNASGSSSGTVGVITKVVGDSVWVRLLNSSAVFTTGETLVQVGSNDSINGVVSQLINTSLLSDLHKIKVFGVSTLNSGNVAPTTTGSATKSGTSSGTLFTYHYWISQFRFSDGKIAATLKIVDTPQHSALSLFNLENNISLTLSRFSGDYGIAVYRGITSDPTLAELVTVLGPNNLGSLTTGIIFSDYGTFANTDWSTKDPATNTFTTSSGLIHFPLTPNSTSMEGWRTMTVESISNASVIKCTETVTVAPGAIIEFVHDNTAGLQQAIYDNRDLSLKNLILPNGTYYTSRLFIPNDFNIVGSGKQTIIKQLPWNFDNINDNVYPNGKGNILMSPSQLPENISLREMTIDGNFVNNTQYSEVQSNYIVALPNAKNIDLNKVNITNSVGGGIYAYGSEYIRVQDSSITNGSLTYQGENLSPIYASSSDHITITGNLCENFVSPVDVSVANIGVVVGNTIRNCGSGLLVYGSSNLLSSPNLLMGPDNEYLPSPDTQDSDYNSINIQIPAGGVDYLSPSHLYMSRGDVIWLGSTDDDSTGTTIPGTAVTLSSDIFVLTKYQNSEIEKTNFDYSTYTVNGSTNPRITIITPDTGSFGRNSGYFQYRVIAAAAASLPSLTTLQTTHGSSLLTGERIVGLVYRIKATAYTYTGVTERLIIQSGEFSNVGGNFYTVTLASDIDFPIFSINDKVKIFGHSSTPEVNTSECTVVQKIDGGTGFKQLKLQIPITVSGSLINGGTTGYITIKNTFIIAKGRIL